jgi:hypothetical protein
MKRLQVLMDFILMFCVLTLGGLLSAQAPETLTNETVLRLWRAGMSESFIVDRIQQMPGIFQLTGADLQTLTDNRIPDRVIDAMYAKRGQNQRVLPSGGFTQNASAQNLSSAPPVPNQASSLSSTLSSPQLSAQPPSAAVPAGIVRGGGVPPPPALPQAASNATFGPDSGTGAVFYRRGNNWDRADPETMTWQNRGVAKKAAKIPSMGIVGKTPKARLFGEHSRNNLTGVPEIVVAVPSGTNMQNYLMVQMKQGKGERIVEVGDSRNHAAHNSIAFGAQKLGTVGQYDQYRIEMPDGFAPGEYGVYNVATVFNASTAASNSGGSAKIYTFSIQ